MVVVQIILLCFPSRAVIDILHVVFLFFGFVIFFVSPHGLIVALLLVLFALLQQLHNFLPVLGLLLHQPVNAFLAVALNVFAPELFGVRLGFLVSLNGFLVSLQVFVLNCQVVQTCQFYIIAGLLRIRPLFLLLLLLLSAILVPFGLLVLLLCLLRILYGQVRVVDGLLMPMVLCCVLVHEGVYCAYVEMRARRRQPVL